MVHDIILIFFLCMWIAGNVLKHMAHREFLNNMHQRGFNIGESIAGKKGKRIVFDFDGEEIGIERRDNVYVTFEFDEIYQLELKRIGWWKGCILKFKTYDKNNPSFEMRFSMKKWQFDELIKKIPPPLFYERRAMSAVS